MEQVEHVFSRESAGRSVELVPPPHRSIRDRRQLNLGDAEVAQPVHAGAGGKLRHRAGRIAGPAQRLAQQLYLARGT